MMNVRGGLIPSALEPKCPRDQQPDFQAKEMLFCLLVAGSTWCTQCRCDVAFYCLWDWCLHVWLCLLSISVNPEQSLILHFRWRFFHPEVRLQAPPPQGLSSNKVFLLLFCSFFLHPICFPKAFMGPIYKDSNINRSSKASQTKWRGSLTVSTKQCVVSENQFCLSISNKWGMRKTIISIIPIIESRTYFGSSEEASPFPGTER